MKISEKLKSGEFSISFEFFPPKTPEGEEQLFNAIRSLERLRPSFVSVTYGAGGSTRDRTRKIVLRIHNETSLTVMAHLTCLSHTREELLDILGDYKENSIENILALRGDVPRDTSSKSLQSGFCKYAVDLVKLVRSEFGDHFSLGVASYPEGHPESPNLEWEVKYFKLKVDAGADFSITQMFFDNSYYYRFAEICEREGIAVPIIPGIMPITNFKQIKKFASMCGATIPQRLVSKMEAVADNREEVEKLGVEFAINQCEDLIRNGVAGLHFYTLNKSKATLEIYEAISGLLK